MPRICIRDVKEAFSVRPRFPDAFEYLVLDVQDSEEQNLIRLFPTFVLHIMNYPDSCPTHIRAQQFINVALSRGGRVLVHCNGKLLHVLVRCLDERMVSIRRDQSITSIRDYVCHATLSDLMGRRSPLGPKSAVLHISEWWIFNPDQGWSQEGNPLFTRKQNADSARNNVTGIRKHLQSQLSGINVPGEPPGSSTSETGG